MSNGDFDITQAVAARIDDAFVIAIVDRPLEHIGRGGPISRGGSGNLLKLLARKDNALEVLDLGVIAKDIGEGQIANRLPADVVSRLNRRSGTGTEIIVDGLEHVVQCIGVIRSEVVVALGPFTKRTVIRKVSPRIVRIT